MIEPIRKPTQPTTAAGRTPRGQQDDSALRLLRMAAPRLAIGGAATDAWLFEVRAFLKTADLPPSAPPGLKSIEQMAAEQGVGPIEDIDALSIDLTDEEADAFTAAMAPSAPPALDPCPHCEQVVLTDGEHWVPNGGGWSCARLEQDP